MPEHPKPGPQHQHLAQMVGTWDAVMTMPDGQKAVGVMTYKSDLNGFWLLGSYKCDFLGQPFQGHAIDGYDQSKNKYVSIWVDSMSSWPMVMDGDLDEKTKTLTVRGQGPGCDGKTLTTFQCVTVFDSPDTMKWKMETIDASGKATLMMSTVYSRRKADTPTK